MYEVPLLRAIFIILHYNKHITTTTLDTYYTSPVVEMKPNNTTIIIIRKNLNRVSIGFLEYLKYSRETPHTDVYTSSALNKINWQ